ncbi:hypothetical protein, partial [Nitrososphaera sp.]|uniref:hypothetical protein n=1 Tax=Nitrososphaera sp. TaxID=1971748 RepID=UPI00307D3265
WKGKEGGRQISHCFDSLAREPIGGLASGEDLLFQELVGCATKADLIKNRNAVHCKNNGLP